MINIYLNTFSFLILCNVLVIIFITCYSLYKYKEDRNKDILIKLKRDILILLSSLIGLGIIKMFLMLFKKFH